MKISFDKWKPELRRAAGIAGKTGQEKFCEYAPMAADIARDLAGETHGLSGRERKKAMKKLVLAKIRAPFFVKWFLSPLIGRTVSLMSDFTDLRDCIYDADGNPVKKLDAGTAVLRRLKIPFYLRWAVRPIIGTLLDAAAQESAESSS